MTTLQGNSFTWYPFNQVQRRTATGLNFTYGYTTDSERLLSWNRAISPDRFSITIRDLDGKVIREFAFDGGTTTYTWVKDYIHANGKLLATVDDEHGTRHYHLDHLGTPRVITDASGQLITDDEGEPIGINAYSPFGIQLIGESEERLKFTAHERDAGSIDYMHARYYSPIVARFLSVDPAGLTPDRPQSWNRYTYSCNGSLSYLDPDGREVLVFIEDIDDRERFIREWEEKTGYALRIERGVLRIVGSVMDENGKQIGSEAARKILGLFIGAHSVFTIHGVNNDSKVAMGRQKIGTTDIIIDFADISAQDFGENNPSTYDSAMVSLHELLHTIGLTDIRSKNHPTGDTVDVVNLVRRQLNYPQRLEYEYRSDESYRIYSLFEDGPVYMDWVLSWSE
jgi:RHS repeat-associated protein